MRLRLDRWLPAAACLRGYDRATLGHDLFAALDSELTRHADDLPPPAAFLPTGADA